MAPKDPVQPASMVLTAIEPMRNAPLPEAPSVLPGLNPNHPKARMKQPVSTRTMSWPGMALEEHTSELQSLAYLVCRLLLEKKKPPTECTTAVAVTMMIGPPLGK